MESFSQTKLVIYKKLILPAVILVVLAVQLTAQVLKADYQFQGDLTSSVPGAPAMTALTGSGGPNFFTNDVIDGYSRQALRFPFMSGVSVSTAGLIPYNNFTLVILFRLSQLSGYRRVIDFNNGALQCGGYIYNSRFEFESTAANNPILMSDIYVQAVMVRESTGRVRVYRDGVLKIDEPQDQGCFAINSSAIRFFQDDSQFPNEASAGSVARIRLYDGAMSTSQILNLDRVPTISSGVIQSVLFSSGRDGNTEIYSMNPDGSNQTRLTNNSSIDFQADYSPNLEKIVFTSTRDGNQEIYVMNADGTSPQRLTSNTQTDFRPQWSPAGNKILFSRCNSSGACQIYTMNVDGSSQRQITFGPSTVDNDWAKWSPDGTKIVFSSEMVTASTHEIFIVNADGLGAFTRMTSDTFDDIEPAFSPDGQKILFTSSRSGQNDIYSISTNGTALTRLTTDPLNDSIPVWSPNGAKIMFSSTRQTSGALNEVFVMNANGTETTRLTFNNQLDDISDWVQLEPAVITGQVTTPTGLGLRNAVVSLTDSQGVRRMATTGSFGLFSFDNVVTGQIYTVGINSKRFRFTPLIINISGNLSNVNFVGLE